MERRSATGRSGNARPEHRPGLERAFRTVAGIICGSLLWTGPGHTDSRAAETSAPPESTGRAERTGVEGADRLAPSTGAPWNPSQPIPRRLAWERAVLLPGRLVTLPLSGLGYGTEHLLLYLEQSGHINTVPSAARAAMSSYYHLNLASFGNRTGFGPSVELRTPGWGGTRFLQAGAKYQATTRFYNETLLGVSAGPLSVRYAYDWRPQDQFHGVGAESREAPPADYAHQSESVQARLVRPWGVGGRLLTVALWGGTTADVTRTGRDPGQQSFERVFPDQGFALGRQVEHAIYGAGVTGDMRRGAPRWADGWRTSLSVERHDRAVAALALRTASASQAQFTRIAALGEVGRSFMRDPRTVRLMIRVVDQRVTSGREWMLPSELSALGGGEGLAGCEPGRFHDVDLAAGKLSYLFPLARRVELDLHSEWGATYADVWRDAKLSTLHPSWGFAVRGRANTRVRGALGLEFSPEGLRVAYTLGTLE